MIPAANEKRKIPLFSGEYYGYCTIGGILSCGLTHTAVTPLDVVKCRPSSHSTPNSTTISHAVKLTF